MTLQSTPRSLSIASFGASHFLRRYTWDRVTVSISIGRSVKQFHLKRGPVMQPDSSVCVCCKRSVG